MDNKLPELLSPAGSLESLKAALAAGADAVYFGATNFSNRMRAKNFTSETITDAIKLCHSVGAKAHITVNTRIRDRELDSVISLADILLGKNEDEQADALIVADLGVAEEIKRRYPHANLHASTQTSMMSVSDCIFLASRGFSRLVVPREMSMDEIKKLVKLSPVEIEMFIHGAHCVSCSGQCLMSYAMGGRSGNRGECAQPCRLSYCVKSSSRQVGGQYPLSMSDMCLASHIPEIISSGVASLKIEGRLKTASYVYGVTSIYRRLLDENRSASGKEISDLEDLFTRGFTDGYYKSVYTSMAAKPSAEKGSDSIEEKKISSMLAKRVNEHKETVLASRIPLKAKFTLKYNIPAEFRLYLGDKNGTAVGDIPTESTGNPVTPDSVSKNLVKTGDSGYSLKQSDIEFDMDDGLWLPLSSINALRRKALESLLSELDLVQPKKDAVAPVENLKINKDISVPETTAEIHNLSYFLRDGEKIDLLLSAVSRLYLSPEDIYTLDPSVLTSGKICANMLPFSTDETDIKATLKKLTDLGIKRVLCHTPGQVLTVDECGLIPDASFRTNVTNSYAANEYSSLGCASLTLSPELNPAQARDIAACVPCDAGIIGYGRIPLMLLSRCIICGGKCEKGNRGGRIPSSASKKHFCAASISDRKEESFPVLSNSDCTNTVFNSTPIWMGDRYSELKLNRKASFIHFIFSTETLSEAVDILNAYRTGEKRTGRRIQ